MSVNRKLVVSKKAQIKDGDLIVFISAENRRCVGRLKGKTVETNKDAHLLFKVEGKVVKEA